MNRTYRLSLPSWATTQREAYYAQMARRGYFVSRCGTVLTRFQIKEPKALLYRLDAASHRNEEPPEEQLQLYESCGWNFVCKSDWFNLYSAVPGTKELHTDPEWQRSTLKPVRRSLCMDLIIKFLYIVFWLFFLFFGNWNYLWRDMTFHDTLSLMVLQLGWVLPIFVLHLLLQLPPLITALFHFSHYMRHLCTDKSVPVRSLKAFVIRHHVLTVLSMLFTVILILSLLSLIPHAAPLGSISEDRHLIRLQQLDPDTEIFVGKGSVGNIQSNTADVSNSPLASLQIDCTQLSASDGTGPTLFQHYIELRSPIDPNSVAYAMAKRSFLYDVQPFNVDDLPSGLDYALVSSGYDGIIELCAVHQNRILLLQYFGTTPVDKVLPIVAEALAQ